MSDRKVEEILAELGQKIYELMKEAKEAGSKVSEDMEKHIAKLKVQKEKLEDQIKNQSSKSGKKWSEAREHLNEATEALRKAFLVLWKT